ncbi:cell filamentation protein Fic (plasmid) [Cupriavidus necator]|uniref:Cell filamentation protein Fic n=1 Tax=Cupriavidus necator TaxID=106590 RepID=A0A1U9V3H2_CUPNE|nr:Fic family protein [Cupriavidus necator]AQV99443.1 cell filamentation protein Fic [Cupriavidus necator]
MPSDDTAPASEPQNPRIGRYVSTVAFDETVNAYVPPPLPPEPPLTLNPHLLQRLSEADRAIGRLDGVAMLLPDKALFLYMYVRKEAVLSSQIEGTQSTLDDLLQYENAALAGKPLDDITEVSNYVDAMMYGLGVLRDPKGLPLCLRLIRDMHSRLLQKGRGEAKNPGEFRRSQNWLGGTRPGNAHYVPPPVNEMETCLSDLERFLHDDYAQIPPLIKAGFLHVQFESIHPFLDGNGRLGRLLIALFLVEKKVLQEPLLYLSLYLKTHREQYYRLLQDVRLRGDWEAWTEFFLSGVAETANNAHESAMRIVALFQADRERISASGEQTNSMLRIHELLRTHPFLNAAQAQQKTGLSAPTVNKAFEALENLEIVKEITGKQRGRVFAYTEFLRILDSGTEVQAPPRQ